MLTAKKKKKKKTGIPISVVTWSYSNTKLLDRWTFYPKVGGESPSQVIKFGTITRNQ